MNVLCSLCTEHFLIVAGWIGTIAFAVSGIISSLRKNLDLMGTYIVSILSCSGGGIIRDVLLNKQPALLYSQNTFLIVLVLTLIFKFLRKGNVIENVEGKFIFRISDTLGLVAYTIIGAQTAINHGLSFFPVMTIALFSSVGGGLVRDALLGKIAQTLTSEFYGSTSIIVGAMVYIASSLQCPQDYYLPAIFVLGSLIRILVIRYRINLAKFFYSPAIPTLIKKP